MEHQKKLNLGLENKIISLQQKLSESQAKYKGIKNIENDFNAANKELETLRVTNEKNRLAADRVTQLEQEVARLKGELDKEKGDKVDIINEKEKEANVLREAAELKEQQRRLNNDSNDNHRSSADDDIVIGRERRESGHGHNGVNGQRESRASVPPHGRDNDDIIGQDDILEGEEDNYDETSSLSPPAAKRLRHSSQDDLSRVRDREYNDNERASEESSPRKRPSPGYNTTSLNASGLPGANIKISSRSKD